MHPFPSRAPARTAITYQLTDEHSQEFRLYATVLGPVPYRAVLAEFGLASARELTYPEQAHRLRLRLNHVVSNEFRALQRRLPRPAFLRLQARSGYPRCGATLADRIRLYRSMRAAQGR